MGYTHYWNTKRTDNQVHELDQMLWTKKFVPLVKQIFKLAAEDGIVLADGNGTPGTRPKATKDEIVFNGAEPNMYETCVVKRSGMDFEFCKTAHRPYDTVVVAVILAAKQIFGDNFSWSSDGEGPDFQDGRDLLNRAVDSQTAGV